MGNVNIPVTVVGGVVQMPPIGNADRANQKIVWTIANPPGSGITFANPPFVFDNPPPAGFDPWPGSAVTAGPGANQWQANVNKLIPGGGTSEKYKYDIVWTTGRMDPEIQNEGFPRFKEKKDKDKEDKDAE